MRMRSVKVVPWNRLWGPMIDPAATLRRLAVPRNRLGDQRGRSRSDGRDVYRRWTDTAQRRRAIPTAGPRGFRCAGEPLFRDRWGAVIGSAPAVPAGSAVTLVRGNLQAAGDVDVKRVLTGTGERMDLELAVGAVFQAVDGSDP